MRVFDASGSFDRNIGPAGSKKASEKKSSKGVSRDKVNESNFTQQLHDAAEDQAKRSLDELLEELSRQAEVLAKRRTFTELDKYKALVKNFMKNVIEKIYSVSFSDSSKYMVKRKKVFVLVEKVDEELEKLTSQFLTSQAETMDLLAVIDRIKGMLVDMYT
ncbi:MAG TPA: DUF327 family protein [Firmicutes bacterium]|nr:DUF327 family protein [Bacillota bacterium]